MLDQSRVIYDACGASGGEADADHVKVKTEMLQLKLASARREMVRRADVDALIDDIAGVTLTALSTQATWRC
jgi:predicted ThiF/HesA family dinucleotide-utilizing enzyme